MSNRDDSAGEDCRELLQLFGRSPGYCALTRVNLPRACQEPGEAHGEGEAHRDCGCDREPHSLKLCNHCPQVSLLRHPSVGAIGLSGSSLGGAGPRANGHCRRNPLDLLAPGATAGVTFRSPARRGVPLLVLPVPSVPPAQRLSRSSCWAAGLSGCGMIPRDFLVERDRSVASVPAASAPLPCCRTALPSPVRHDRRCQTLASTDTVSRPLAA